MPGQGRLGDKGQVQADSHGCPACPHPGIGPAIAGSPNVFVNGRPALRKNDMGIHAICCGPNMWTASAGSATVFINGQPAHRLNDAQQHCGGLGKLIEGSADVIVGDGGGAGGGGGGSSASGGAFAGSGAYGAGHDSTAKQKPAAPGSGPSSSGSSQEQSASAASSGSAVRATDASKASQEAAARWKAVWSDDLSPVGGLKSHFEGPNGAKDLDGGEQSVSGLNEDAPYSVTLVGNTVVKGKLTDENGRGLKGRLRIERAFGEAVEIESDVQGSWQAEGFVQGDPYLVHVISVEPKSEPVAQPPKRS